MSSTYMLCFEAEDVKFIIVISILMRQRFFGSFINPEVENSCRGIHLKIICFFQINNLCALAELPGLDRK